MVDRKSRIADRISHIADRESQSAIPDSQSLVLRLLPMPREVEMGGGVYELIPGRLILLDAADPQALRFAASRFQAVLSGHAGLTWEMVASAAIPEELIGLALRLAPERVAHPQGYELTIGPKGIEVAGHDPAGVFYGVCTLIQVIESNPQPLIPAIHISDWPDFPARGVMLDISRDKVPTMETLYGLVDMLAGWKVNQLQLYTEHTFAYRNHPEVWAQASPVTGQEILELDAFCRERHIELVPNQNSFGHMERWLVHPRYAPLAEIHDPFPVPWGMMEGPFSLAPNHPGSLELLRSLYDELLPHFSSRQFNVGCDETFDLGQGQSKADCQSRGAGRVYLDFLLRIYREVAARGRQMQFWGDIIIHHPDLIPELPRDAIALEWGYEADHPFADHGARFAGSGVPFYVCPGTSSWCSIAGRTDNALGNLLNAAENGLQHGAIGYLNTDWGDRGHWQPLPVSYLGFAVGAAYSWALEANRRLDVAAAVSRHAFRDPTGAAGRVACDLGNVYQAVGYVPHNGSVLFWLLQLPVDQLREQGRFSQLPAAAWTQAEAAIERALAPLAGAAMARGDAGLIRREFELAGRLLRHACRRGRWLLADARKGAAWRRAELAADLGEIIAEYRGLWLARNRPGGLADSVARLERARADYL